jgi:hypothetical protein
VELLKTWETCVKGKDAAQAWGCWGWEADYSNCLISGSTMRPITDKLYISREKLAQIVDSSAAALASLAPISGWIGFELSLIADELKNLESEGADLSKYPQSAYLLFLGTIPTR